MSHAAGLTRGAWLAAIQSLFELPNLLLFGCQLPCQLEVGTMLLLQHNMILVQPLMQRLTALSSHHICSDHTAAMHQGSAGAMNGRYKLIVACIECRVPAAMTSHQSHDVGSSLQDD